TEETTLGFVNHIYNQPHPDEVTVWMIAQDNSGCVDSTSLKNIYLSEPDTSQFRIMSPLSCYADTVQVFGIQGKYINSWYFRYRDSTNRIFIKPDVKKMNLLPPTGAFGVSFPNVDST